jgi:predicted transcriptional regulator
MSSEEGQQPEQRKMLDLTDPKAMRALAHPVRMALLDLLAVQQTLTATQASEALGESPANCAFHLRTLAKYGFVREAGGGRGRERPWEVVHQSFNLSTNLEDPQAHVAAEALGNVWLDRWMGRVRRAVLRTWPDEWEAANVARQALMFLTAEETAQVGREMGAIIDRYTGRNSDPSLRPAGAVPVEFAIIAYPRDDLAPLPAEKETDEQLRDIS